MYRRSRVRPAWRESPARGDLLPVADRLRYLRVLRLALAALVTLAVLVPPGGTSWRLLAIAVLEWLGGSLLLERAWRATRRAPAGIAPLLLLGDVAALGWAAGASGAAGGWVVRCLVLVHVTAVAMLVSRRLLALVVVAHGVVQLLVGAAVGVDGGALAVYGAVLVALGLSVAWLSVVTVRELQRRRFELEALAQMGRRLEEAHDPVAVGTVLLDSVCSTFGFRRVVLFDLAEGSLRMLACDGLDDAVVRDFTVSSSSVLTAATRDRRPLVVPRLDPVDDPWLDGVLPRARNLVVMPLTADEVVGVLVADPGRLGAVDDRATAVVERFTAHAAYALRNAVLLERVQQMAVTDALTRLANRRSFDRALARDLARAQRTDDGRVSVVLLDVDEFKRLNDTFGHVVGDEVLREVAAVLQDCGREYDTVARYGGEEFVVVLPGCSTSVAAKVAERLRSRIDTAPTRVPVTVSAGVATYPAHGADAHALIESADFALYAAKRAGRNRVFTVEQARAARGSATG